MKLFLDVGAHEGQTLAAVLDPKYAFDKIFAFEPVGELHEKLESVSEGNNKVQLLKYGLWNKDAEQKIYSPGTLAGSLFSSHEDVKQDDFELCRFVDASAWFRENVAAGDEVFMKLNCEGAEADILMDLLESKEIFKIKNVMIDFDVRKVKELEDRGSYVLNKFEEQNFHSYSLCEKVMFGPTQLTRIQYWLDRVDAKSHSLAAKTKQLFYWTRMVFKGKRPGYAWEVKQVIKRFTPSFIIKLARAKRR